MIVENIETATKVVERKAKYAGFNEADLDEFVTGYLLCWLFFETLPPPADGETWMHGDSFFDGADFVLDDLTVASRRKVRAHCRKLLTKIAHLIPGNRQWFEETEFQHAGHDAAMTCQGIDEGFARSEWKPIVRPALVAACAEVGGLFVEPARGRIHVT